MYFAPAACCDASWSSSVVITSAMRVGAAAAASGAVGLIHVVGSSPEASTTEEALGGRPAAEMIVVGPEELRVARDDLSTGSGRVLGRLPAHRVFWFAWYNTHPGTRLVK